MSSITTLIPVIIFLIVMLGVSFWVRNQSKYSNKKDFTKEYFIGGRSLGGFVLAMTTVATYSSVSTFVGGPGQAWSIGFGWIYMAMVQVTAIFLVLGIFGKKIALISRKIDAVTVIDVIRRRYQSDLLANIAAIIIVVFFAATMIAQFVGGAKLFETVTGYPYLVGLLIFGLIVIFYTTIGGFKGVALTDTFCAIAMLVGMVILLFSVLKAGGGYSNVMNYIEANHPEMLEPLSGGNMPYTTYFTQWLLVGICTISLPQSVVRGISYKDTKSLHRAMIIGTVVIGAMVFGAHLVGVFSRAVLTEGLDSYGGSVDYIMPLTIIKTMNPILAGITVIGPIAATISTVSSLLITTSSAIIKDMYLHSKKQRGQNVANSKIAGASMITTVAIGMIVFVLSITPPSVIWKINMFAFGGLETAFFWTLVLGLFWKGANKTGAICSMLGGTLSYCMTMALGIKFFNMHQIVIGITVAFVLFVIGSKLGKAEDEETLCLFFPEKVK